MAEEGDKRAAARQPVLKAAKAYFGAAVIDCLILDFSAQGARIGLDGFVAFPDSLVLELRTGSRWNAIRRWQRGTEVGLEFSGFAGLSVDASLRAAACLDDLRRSGLRSIANRMEQERFFDYPELRSATERLDEAASALEALLKAVTDAR